MKTRIILMSFLFIYSTVSFSMDATTSNSTSDAGLFIWNRSNVYGIRVNCVDLNCSQIKLGLEVKGEGIPSDKRSTDFILTSVDEVLNYVKNTKIERRFMIPELFTHNFYDPSAGGLNVIALPIIYIVGGLAAITVDAVETVTPQNWSMQRTVNSFKATLAKAVEGRQVLSIEMSNQIQFEKMMDLLEKAVVSQQTSNGRTNCNTIGR